MKRSFIYKTQSVEKVTPCVGVWIETRANGKNRLGNKSHPAWVCGLKPPALSSLIIHELVTPCVGVWIETVLETLLAALVTVTPCVGVWIETQRIRQTLATWVSHPAWVCGLKQGQKAVGLVGAVVTPCVGVWIETKKSDPGKGRPSVTPCVGVWIETLAMLSVPTM